MKAPDPPPPTPGPPSPAQPGRTARRALYLRLLGLRTIRPNGWQRALLGEGSVVVAIVLTLADVASAWVIVALPVLVALVVKANDVLAGELRRRGGSGRSTPGPASSTRTARTPGPRRDPAPVERKN